MKRYRDRVRHTEKTTGKIKNPKSVFGILLRDFKKLLSWETP